MVSAGMEIVGMAMAIIGFLGSIIICGLPMWKVTAFTGSYIVTAQVWEGLWMSCVSLRQAQMKCKVYDSLLVLPQDLQAARALVIISIIVGICGIILSIVGGQCTNFIKEERQKCKVAIAAGVVFLIAGLLVLVPVCWTANTIIHDVYNVLTIFEKRELGASLYIGWGAAGLLVLGGGLLCSACLPSDRYDVKYSKALSVENSRSHV